MALVFALYLLLCVRVTADIRAGLADGRIQFAASVGTLMLEARIDGSVEGAKVQLNKQQMEKRHCNVLKSTK